MNYVLSDPTSSLTPSNLTKDSVVTSHGVTVYVDPSALFNIIGTVMDYEESEISEEFTFKNPQAKGECGCGESFNVD